MFGPVRAVVIDDVPSHLIAISSGLTKAGIPCTSYWYDREEIRLKDKIKPAPPASGHDYLRIIFSDLNLEELPPSQGLAEAIGPALNVISQLVSSNGGPYAVVFWTGTSFTVDQIREELLNRLSAMGVLLPIAVDELNKGPYLVPPSADLNGEEMLVDLYKATYASSTRLMSALQSIVNKYGLLSMLSGWESRAIHAAGKSTNSLYEAVKPSILEGGDITDALRKVSALVAREAVGKSMAKDHPGKAYDAAMLDILVDSFSQSVNEGDYPQVVRDELESTISKSQITINNREIVHAHLNTMFHIDNIVDEVQPVSRGSVIELTKANENGILLDMDSFCCWEDYFWEPDKGNTSCLMPKISSEFSKYFVSEAEKVNTTLSAPAEMVLDSLRKDRKEEQENRYNQLKAQRSEFTKSLNWVLAEVGADCDHAQGKSRTLRYLVAVEVKSKYVESYVRGDKSGGLRNEALRLLGPYIKEDGVFFLLVSLKRFVTWQVPDLVPEIDVLYRLRKNIVDYLLGNYAAWSMRPGITEFKQ